MHRVKPSHSEVDIQKKLMKGVMTMAAKARPCPRVGRMKRGPVNPTGRRIGYSQHLKVEIMPNTT